MNPLRFVVIGIGGFALAHLDAIAWLQRQGLADLVGVVALKEDQDKYPDLMQSLRSRNVAVYTDIDEFFTKFNNNADVLTVPIGIHMHVPVSIRALKAGMHVYCEKPLAATVQEVDDLLSVQKKHDGKLAVGFQYIYSHSIQQLKARICDGRLGAVKDIAMMCGWPRSKQYYSRNDWAGRMRKNNHWILDSPANNAHAHYLLNILYLCSLNPTEAAMPRQVRAELYRANRIEGPDTVQLEFETNDNSKGYAIVSHCNSRELGPIMRLSCQNGAVEWHGQDGNTVIKYQNGTTEEFNNLAGENWRFEGFRNLVESVRADKNPTCTAEMARCHTVTVNAIHESCPEIKQIPEGDIVVLEDFEMFPPDTKGEFRRITKMDDYLQQAFDEKKFLSQLHIPWAKDTRSRPFEIRNYNSFPQSEIT